MMLREKTKQVIALLELTHYRFVMNLAAVLEKRTIWTQILYEWNFPNLNSLLVQYESK